MDFITSLNFFPSNGTYLIIIYIVEFCSEAHYVRKRAKMLWGINYKEQEGGGEQPSHGIRVRDPQQSPTEQELSEQTWTARRVSAGGLSPCEEQGRYWKTLCFRN